jgi:hypothetical protein
MALTDTDATARACALHYDHVRDSVLRSHKWNFAKKPAVLVKLDARPLFGWQYAYALPADFLRVYDVNGSDEGLGEPWDIQGDQLLSDCETIELNYVHRMEDSTKYDPLFVEALSYKLAEKLATAIRGSSAQVVDFTTQYERVTAPRARRIDSNETRHKKPNMPYRSQFVEARGSF